MKEKTKKTIKKVLFTSIQLIIMLTLLDTIGLSKGLLVYLAFIVCFAGYKAYTQWEHVVYIVHNIETTLFGKPLNKDYWKKGDKIKMKKMYWRKR